MNNGLHQMTAEYAPQQDRILFRVSTSAQVEYRLWLTRRLVKIFWGRAVALFHIGPEDDQLKNAMTSMKHQEVVQSSDFSQTHDQGNASAPETKRPLLVAGVTCGYTPEGSILLTFHTAAKRDVNLELNEDMLPALCHIVQQCADKAGWDLQLSLSDTTVVVQPAARHVH